MKHVALHSAITLVVLSLCAMTQQAPGSDPHPGPNAMQGHDHNTHEDEYPAAVTFAELKETASKLERVRQATAKYRDVKVARADGYGEAGDEIKGMGIHFVRELEPDAIHLEKPPMLVYEKSPSGPNGYALVGVVYLMKAEEGPDGQPKNNPFPKPLAIWHKHANVCVFANPDNKLDHTTKLTEAECHQRGGHFNTEWMIHAWVWKDSPLGVFSPKNPVVGASGGQTELHTK